MFFIFRRLNYIKNNFKSQVSFYFKIPLCVLDQFGKESVVVL